MTIKAGRATRARSARRQLDRQFAELAVASTLARPRLGWIRAVRDALGMSSRDLGRRMGISQPSVTALEQGEVADSIRLGSLRRAADAMECELVYFLVPRVSLDDFLTRQALMQADRRLRRVAHHMRLEDQAVDPVDADSQLVDLAQSIVDSGKGIWNDES